MRGLLETKRLGWAVISALVTVMALLSYFTGTRYLGAVRAVEHTLAVESAIHGTITLLVDAETGHRGYLLTGDERFLEPLSWAKLELEPRLKGLDSLTMGDAQQAEHLRAIRGLIQQKLEFIRASEELRRLGNTEEAIARVRSGRGKELMDQIRVHARQMLFHEQEGLSERKAEAQHAEQVAIIGVGVGSVIMVVLALFSLLTVSRDVTELKSAAEELAKSEQHYRLLTDQSSDLVRLIGIDGIVRYVSPSVERMLGYSVDEYIQLPGLSIMHPSEVDIGKRILSDVKSGAETSGVATYRLRHKNGEYRWFEVRWAALRNAEGKVHELHTAGRDVTERREAERQLNLYADELLRIAIRDELTGLYNRRGFLEVAGQAHAQALRDARPCAVIFVDLNGMKRINDEQGHEVGDLALVDTAQVLTSGMREGDVVARLGGDEFVVFARDFAAEQLEPLRGRLRMLADARVAEQKRPFRLSMSLGAALVESVSASSLEQMLERADAAMYEQKNARRAAGGVSIPPPAPSEG
jgi:diguanylate cyclase (GGDEF)-like protein/PAS domain S-box-containing protein